MELEIENRKTALMRELGVPFVGLAHKGEGQAVMLRAMMARELGERAIGAGDEIVVVGAANKAEMVALHALGVMGVRAPADAYAAVLERALSPATKAVWVCADATADSVCTVRNFCNTFDLWMLATVTPQEARRCEFEGKPYHVGAVADVATGTVEDNAFVCTKDELPYHLMRQECASKTWSSVEK